MPIKTGTADQLRELLAKVEQLEAERNTFYKALNRVRAIASAWVYHTFDSKVPIALYMQSSFREIEECGKEAITSQITSQLEKLNDKTSLIHELKEALLPFTYQCGHIHDPIQNVNCLGCKAKVVIAKVQD